MTRRRRPRKTVNQQTRVGRCQVTAADVRGAYYGSDATLTRRVLRALEVTGSKGILAALLFRAQKASARAKQYRGGIGRRHSRITYRDLAYGRKEDAIKVLCHHLRGQPDVRWGWGRDSAQSRAPWVLYVELPGFGQVSFHAPARGEGPEYPSTWDGSRESEDRTLAFCVAILEGERAADEERSSPGSNVRDLVPDERKVEDGEGCPEDSGASPSHSGGASVGGQSS